MTEIMTNIANISDGITTYSIKDSNAVHKTGDETIDGIKSFNNTAEFAAGKGIKIKSSDANEYWNIRSSGGQSTGCALMKNDNADYNAFKAENDHINIGSTNILPYSVTPDTSDNSTRIATTAFVKAQGYTSNTGTITGINMNGASKGTSGVVDLGTVLTEHQSLTNYVTTNTTQTISKTKTFTDSQIISGASKVLKIKNTSVTRNTAPSSAVNAIYINGLDNADKNLWGIYGTWSTAKQNQVQLICYKGTSTDNTYTGIGVGYDSSGNAYTYAPTPAVSDSSTKIATTAYVNNKFKVVTSLPASPDANTIYFIKE